MKTTLSNLRQKGLPVLVLNFACILTSQASELNTPNDFSAGSPAVASEVNANFTAAETAINDNHSRLSTLETNDGEQNTDISELISSVAALEASLAELEATVAVLENDNNSLQNFITNVIPYLDGGPDAQGQPAIFFSGVNLHLNNGDPTSDTETVNGTGNLIIGFDESSSGRSFCFGTSSFETSEPDCNAAGGTWNDGSTTTKIGSHNLILGSGNSYTSY